MNIHRVLAPAGRIRISLPPLALGRAFAQTRWLVILGSMALMGLLGVAMYLQEKRAAPAGGSGQPLVVYCAAGLKPAVEAVADAYQAASHVPIQIQYGGSGTLLSNIKVTKSGDIFLAADASYIEEARAQGLVSEIIPLARQQPVIAVRKGNPKSILALQDLLRKDVSFALANPDQASIGRTVREILGKDGRWDAIQQQAKVMKPTVNDVANDIKIGSVDAGIIWDSTAFQYPELEAVRVPEFLGAVETVTLAVLKSSSDPAAALRFARYMAAPDAGLLEFKRHGFQPADGQ